MGVRLTLEGRGTTFFHCNHENGEELTPHSNMECGADSSAIDMAEMNPECHPPVP